MHAFCSRIRHVLSYRHTINDCATCYASIYLHVVIIIIVVDVGVIESRLRTLPRPPTQSRKSDYAHFLCIGGGGARGRQIAFVAPAHAVCNRQLRAPLGLPISQNSVTLMPEIDDISPGEAAQPALARCPDDVIIAGRARALSLYYFSSPENEIFGARRRPLLRLR